MNQLPTSAALCFGLIRRYSRYSRCSQCFATGSKTRVSTNCSCCSLHSFFHNVHRMQGILLQRLLSDGHILVLYISPFFYLLVVMTCSNAQAHWRGWGAAESPSSVVSCWQLLFINMLLGSSICTATMALSTGTKEE